ncbi:MAG: hypothetical protein WDM78_05310 [Puia sp.]
MKAAMPVVAGLKLREAQSLTLHVPGTGMAVTTDIGDPKDIHPKNKQEVGRRLAVIALNEVYGISQTAGGPSYDSVVFSSDKADLYFKFVGKGLRARDKKRISPRIRNCGTRPEILLCAGLYPGKLY